MRALIRRLSLRDELRLALEFGLELGLHGVRIRLALLRELIARGPRHYPCRLHLILTEGVALDETLLLGGDHLLMHSLRLSLRLSDRIPLRLKHVASLLTHLRPRLVALRQRARGHRTQG